MDHELNELQRMQNVRLKELQIALAWEMYEMKVANMETQISKQGFVYVVHSDMPDGDSSPKNMLLVPDEATADCERMNALIKMGQNPFNPKDNVVDIKISKRDITKEPLSDAEMSQLRMYVSQ